MKIIICGSMKFLREMASLKKELEKKGHKIIIPLPDESYSHGNNIKRQAMEDFNNNLKDADAILVANYDKNDRACHIGINSIMEIGMAFNRKKKIFVLNKIPKECEDELKAINVIELNNRLEGII